MYMHTMFIWNMNISKYICKNSRNIYDLPLVFYIIILKLLIFMRKEHRTPFDFFFIKKNYIKTLLNEQNYKLNNKS